MSAAALLLLSLLFGVPRMQPIQSQQIAHEQGYAYQAVMQPWRAPWPLVVRFDSSEAPEESTALVFENGRALGSAHSPHDLIRTYGAGRFSHWGNDRSIYFSTSDNSDPRTNGRDYAVRVLAKVPWWSLIIAVILIVYSARAAKPAVRSVFVAMASALPAVYNKYPLTARLLKPAADAVTWTSRTVVRSARLAVPSVVGILAAPLLVLAAGEAYFRVTVPFTERTWPIRYIDGVGWLFEPNALVRHTNYLDFWVEERANSLGFLDRERSSVDPKRSCRIAIIGDSFVEAAQVKNQEKVQALLERSAVPIGSNVTISAAGYGYSGTGQLNQLPFYDRYAKATLPDIVVLVFVANDFANNSSLLEAVRHGFHPNHSPRISAELSAGSAEPHIKTSDPNWQKYVIPLGDDVVAPTCWLCRQHRTLVSSSLFYRWITLKLRLLAPQVLAGVEPRAAKSLSAARVEWLSSQPEFAGRFGAWHGETDLDEMFFQPTLPPAFEDALKFTEFAFAEFKRRVEADGGTVVILSASNVRKSRQGNPTLTDNSDLYFGRMRAIADKLDIAVLDQYEWLQRRNEPSSSVEFRHEGHWNQRGHQVAADMILEHIASHPGVCARRLSGPTPSN